MLQNKLQVISAGAGSIGTARHAHIGLMRSVAKQMAARHIRGNTKHLAAPSCAAAADRRGRDFLTTQHSSCVAGSTLIVDGGMSA
jgi:NAD(P)-dependent dehydrogenase (short-subunit alcohol dehydrogenase family)